LVWGAPRPSLKARAARAARVAAGHVRGRYVREGSLEARDYQEALAAEAASKNCIVVLPTGLGKTAVALRLVAKYLERGRGASLMLAPTRVLAEQHRRFMLEHLTISDVALVTGEEPQARRSKLWFSSVVCATPEIAQNDLARGVISPGDFGLVIFDEAHRAVGNYAYTAIAAAFEGAPARLVGMTATLPAERAKVREIIGALRAESVETRHEKSPDVVKYTQDTDTQVIELVLPEEMAEVQSLIKRALNERYSALKAAGIDTGPNRSLSALLRLRAFVLSHRRNAIKALFSAIRITYSLNMFEAHGTTAFLRFCERAAKKNASARSLMEDDEHFSAAVARARALQRRGMEHPKIARLLEILSGTGDKAIVFSSYRDSVEVIRDSLAEHGITAEMLIGKAGEAGLKQKKQVETVARFRAGEYRVLVTTRVGEEGLDISAVNLVIFYDSVPSSIRYVQRRGRTGRHASGRLVSLVTKGTIDVAYHWIGKRKIKAAQRVGASVIPRRPKRARAAPRRKRPATLDDYV